MRAGADRLRHGAQRGLTLVELLVGLAVASLIAIVAAPSYQDATVRARTRAVSDNLATDMQFARSEAVQRNARISMSFSSGVNWCYGIHQGTGGCNCAVANSCSLKTVASTDFPGVTLAMAQFVSAAGVATGFEIDQRRGQVIDSAGAAAQGNAMFSSLTSSGSVMTRVSTNAVGRVRICSPGGSLGGYPTC